MAKIKTKDKEIYDDHEDYFPGNLSYFYLKSIEKDIAIKVNEKGSIKEKSVYYKDLIRQNIFD